MTIIKAQVGSRRDFLRLGIASVLGLTGSRVAAQTPDEKPLPPRGVADRIDGPPIVSARAWAIADGRTGQILWGAISKPRR